MGFDARESDIQFFLPATQKVAANEAIMAAVDGLDTLEETFGLWGFEASTDEEGNIDGIVLESDALSHDLDCVMQALGPFVEAGSYIALVSDGQALFRYYFNGETCTEEYAKVVWPYHAPGPDMIKTSAALVEKTRACLRDAGIEALLEIPGITDTLLDWWEDELCRMVAGAIAAEMETGATHP